MDGTEQLSSHFGNHTSVTLIMKEYCHYYSQYLHHYFYEDRFVFLIQDLLLTSIWLNDPEVNRSCSSLFSYDGDGMSPPPPQPIGTLHIIISYHAAPL